MAGAEQRVNDASRPSRAVAIVRRIGLAVARDLAISVVTAGAIVFAVQHSSPIFASQPTVVAGLLRTAPIARAVVVAPSVDSARIAELVARPEFATDRAAFARDLVRTGRMSQARADSIAYYAVREAYLRGVPPAVVFGVMLTENSLFLSSAMSRVGAIGLMQVYPRIWLRALARRFGTDLNVDSTNLKYGIFILGHYIKSHQGTVRPSDANAGLLQYNGCVQGTAAHCQEYPGTVRHYVNQGASSLCSGHGFYECIARPFLAGLFGTTSR